MVQISTMAHLSPETLSALRVNLDSLARNYAFFRETCSNAETGAAVKANAYGLGLEPVCRRLFEEGCRTFFVAHTVEGAELRAMFKQDVSIYVLHGPVPHDVTLYSDHDLYPVLNTPEQVMLWERHGHGRPCALHFDTGILRLGLDPENTENLTKLPNVYLAMSHLACASDPSQQLNTRQLDVFNQICTHFPTAKKSLAGSAACLLGTKYHFDLVRPGIGLYGGNPMDIGGPQLASVAELLAPVLDVKDVKPGESIGYGATFTANRAMKVAVLAYGYADGLLRAAHESGSGWFEGQRTPLVGRVSMDLSVVDISNCQTMPKVGDSIHFLGTDLDDLAQACGTISYEVLTSIGSRVVREYVGDST